MKNFLINMYVHNTIQIRTHSFKWVNEGIEAGYRFASRVKQQDYSKYHIKHENNFMEVELFKGWKNLCLKTYISKLWK